MIYFIYVYTGYVVNDPLSMSYCRMNNLFNTHSCINLHRCTMSKNINDNYFGRYEVRDSFGIWRVMQMIYFIIARVHDRSKITCGYIDIHRINPKAVYYHTCNRTKHYYHKYEIFIKSWEFI